MKNFISKFKSNLFKNILKLFGVCSLLILFEACYGTQKAAYAPLPEKNKNSEQTDKSTLQQEESSTLKSKI